MTFGDLATPLIRVSNTVGPFTTYFLYNRVYGLIPHVLYCSSNPPTEYSIWRAFISDGIGWLLPLGFVHSAFVYKMDCLDFHESVLFFPQHRLKAVYLPLPFPIMLCCIFHYFPSTVCSACKQSWGSSARCHNQHFSPRDDTLGPLYHGCFVDYHCFLFTGWSNLLNLLPFLHHLHYPPSFFFLLVCHVALTPCTPASHCI